MIEPDKTSLLSDDQTSVRQRADRDRCDLLEIEVR
jgi:hypothetical protein